MARDAMSPKSYCCPSRTVKVTKVALRSRENSLVTSSTREVDEAARGVEVGQELPVEGDAGRR